MCANLSVYSTIDLLIMFVFVLETMNLYLLNYMRAFKFVSNDHNTIGRTINYDPKLKGSNPARVGAARNSRKNLKMFVSLIINK